MAKNKLTTAAQPMVRGEPYRPSKEELERERKWKAKDAIETLNRAADIKKDKELMGHVRRHAAEESEKMGKLAKGKC